MEYIKLKDLASINIGQQIDTKAIKKVNKYKYVNGGIEPSGFYNEFNCTGETITISEGGASCGFVNYYSENFWCGCHCYMLKAKGDSKYLYYALKGNEKRLMEIRTGAAMPNIKKSSLSEMIINVDLNIENQKNVVELLDNLNSMIETKRDQLEEYENLIKSRFIEMFGDLEANSNSYKKEEFKNLCVKISDGLHGTPKYDDNGGYYFVNGNNLGNNDIKITSATRRVNESEYKKHFFEFNSKTIFLSINGTLGNVAFYNNEPIILGKSVAYCILKDTLNKTFVSELFKSDYFKLYMISHSTGSTITNFGLKAFREYSMIVPPIDLQNQFASFVKLIDKSKVVYQSRYFLCEFLTFVSSTRAYSNVVSILACPNIC